MTVDLYTHFRLNPASASRIGLHYHGTIWFPIPLLLSLRLAKIDIMQPKSNATNFKLKRRKRGGGRKPSSPSSAMGRAARKQANAFVSPRARRT